VGALTFDRVDLERYPALGLALEAGRKGGTYPAALCAADEIAVSAFLEGAIGFLDITAVVEETLSSHTPCQEPHLADILAADRWARSVASRLVLSRRRA
jgi:1-deoxy-D-xylulose-5-phosphate reductoisomerase